MTETEKNLTAPETGLTREALIEKINQGETLTEEEVNFLKYENHKEEVKQLDRIIRGVNDTFYKEYDFKEWGLQFSISIKAPNALEQGKIQARREAYLEGMGMAVSPFMFQAFQMLATIRVCGVEVPKILESDEDIYNLNLLYRIGADYIGWLDSFRY